MLLVSRLTVNCESIPLTGYATLWTHKPRSRLCATRVTSQKHQMVHARSRATVLKSRLVYCRATPKVSTTSDLARATTFRLFHRAILSTYSHKTRNGGKRIQTRADWHALIAAPFVIVVFKHDDAESQHD